MNGTLCHYSSLNTWFVRTFFLIFYHCRTFTPAKLVPFISILLQDFFSRPFVSLLLLLLFPSFEHDMSFISIWNIVSKISACSLCSHGNTTDSNIDNIRESETGRHRERKRTTKWWWAPLSKISAFGKADIWLQNGTNHISLIFSFWQ